MNPEKVKVTNRNQQTIFTKTKIFNKWKFKHYLESKSVFLKKKYI